MLRPPEVSNTNSRRGSAAPVIKAKVVFLGDAGVGKTSLLMRHEGRGVERQPTTSTIRANYLASSIFVGGEKVELRLWDTAGQERFRSMVPQYLRKSQAVLLTYDVTNRKSFEHIRLWIGEINNVCWSQRPLVFLVGNKIDCPNRVITIDEGEEYARMFDATHLETSAETGFGVPAAFHIVAEQLLSRHFFEPETGGIRLGKERKTKRRAVACCAR